MAAQPVFRSRKIAGEDRVRNVAVVGGVLRDAAVAAEPQIACAVQVFLYSAIAFVATFFAPETKGRDLTLVEDTV